MKRCGRRSARRRSSRRVASGGESSSVFPPKCVENIGIVWGAHGIDAHVPADQPSVEGGIDALVFERTRKAVAGQQRHAFVFTTRGLEPEDRVNRRRRCAVPRFLDGHATMPASAATRSSSACGSPTAHALIGFDRSVQFVVSWLHAVVLKPRMPMRPDVPRRHLERVPAGDRWLGEFGEPLHANADAVTVITMSLKG